MRLMTPRPMMTSPPQSPGLRSPAARAEVKTMGRSAVPWATMRAPRRTKSADSCSPCTTVPGWMVRVAPLVTLMNASSL